MLLGKEEGRAAVRTQEAAADRLDADRLQDPQPPGRLRNLEEELDFPGDHTPMGVVRAGNPVRAGRVDSAAKADTLLKST